MLLNGAETNFYLLLVDQDRDRVAICDTHDLAHEVVWATQEDAGEED